MLLKLALVQKLRQGKGRRQLPPPPTNTVCPNQVHRYIHISRYKNAFKKFTREILVYETCISHVKWIVYARK